LAAHWQVTLDFLQIITGEWPNLLRAVGKVDSAKRRNELLHALITRWSAIDPPQHMVVAAGMVATAPVVAELLQTIAGLPDGLVVLPGLDTAMSDEAWASINCHLTDPEKLSPRVDSEGHPQFAFRCLLERMKVARAEVETWGHTTPLDGPAPRTDAVGRAMAPARFTNEWQSLDLKPDALAGVRLIEAGTPSEEAQVVALALRRQLDQPGRTAALVTPDRGLARRVAAHLARYGVAIDDSAGVALRVTPPGTFMLALAEAAAQGFAPVPLLGLLKHPLVAGGDRLPWLDKVRRLDRALRGVRPAPGLDTGIAAHVNEADPALLPWWRADVVPILEPLEQLFARRLVSLPDLIDRLRRAGEALVGEDLWRGPAGRALGQIIERLEEYGHHLDPFDPPDAPALLGAFFQETAVRPPYGRHPRLAIYGLLEARLQRADLMILGGLNEGVWPGIAAPDPWLAPAARAQLGLPGLERKVGLAAHDFVQAMGGAEVLVTRARRDASGPTVPSRFWLRLEAMAGGRLAQDAALLGIARGLDRPAEVRPARRPAPAPPSNARPRELSVTQVERLKADPFSFYADKVLGLRKLSPLDEDPTAAERGTFLHRILERWVKERPGEPAHLRALAELMLDADWGHHPLMRALWAPRVLRAVDWVATETAAWGAQGWRPLAAEAQGLYTLGNGITLTGRADRVDVNEAGELAIVDYKTGGVPSYAQLEGGFALQLGLLAWMAEGGKIRDVPAGTVRDLRYWKLSGGRKPGEVKNPLRHGREDWTDISTFVDTTVAHFIQLCDDLLLGSAPFTAKLHPEHSTHYTDHDHLARVAEWMGRGDSSPLERGET
jgi:ATP-dependent helicase/nuclease subunit B